ncbi:MAG: hypothetical protein HY241_16375 [Actinobacteria bacterium]|nr:hypothetical protein [Actinomycetota bacterium]
MTFLMGEGDDPATIENVDAELTLEDGTRWSATFLTLREVGEILDRWKDSGEFLSGGYLRIPDLIVTREAGLTVMAAALRDLLEKGVEGYLVRLPA